MKITVANKIWWFVLVASGFLSFAGYAQSGWNLSLKDQPGFTAADAQKLIKPLYDTMDLRYELEYGELRDTMELNFEPLRFFEADDVQYALQVIENQGPGYGVSVGWCDLALFRKEQDGWKLQELMLHAGGGGMYGNSGQFKGLVRIGKHAAGIVLSGGQTHMGELYHDDIVVLRQGKLSTLLMLYTHHSYGEWDESKDAFKVCEENAYEFLESDKDWYDLRIIRSNCLDKQEGEVGRVILPYKEGYNIPAGFIFEG